jgi:hypothetical protein
VSGLRFTFDRGNSDREPPRIRDAQNPNRSWSLPHTYPEPQTKDYAIIARTFDPAGRQQGLDLLRPAHCAAGYWAERHRREYAVTRGEIIALAVERMGLEESCPNADLADSMYVDDFVDDVIANLAQQLPDGEIKICDDFKGLGVACCDASHYRLDREMTREGNIEFCAIMRVLTARCIQ